MAPLVKQMVAFVNDDPFGPPNYNDFMITHSHDQIDFNDSPGWTGQGATIGPGEWLDSYSIEFRWIITNLNNILVYTSTTQSYSTNSAYNSGNNVAIVYNIPANIDVKIDPNTMQIP